MSAVYKIKYSFAVLLICAGVLSVTETYAAEPASPVYRIAPAASWVEVQPMPKQAVVSEDASNGTRHLLLEKQINYSLKERQCYQRLVQRISHNAGLEKASKIEIDFFSDYQTLRLHNVTLIRNGKEIEKLNSKNISLLRKEKELEKELLTGEQTVLIVVDDTRVGDIIDYSYTVSGSNPIFNGRISEIFPLGWPVPVDKVYNRLVVSSDKYIEIKEFNTTLPHGVKKNGALKEYVWITKTSEVIRPEDEYPTWYNPYPYIQISDYKTWKSVAEWASPLYSVPASIAPDLKKKIHELTDKQISLEEKICNILFFVQNEIRYLGVEIGVNSHKPHHPNITFANRYGDCKDKTLLLISMLNSIGVKAYPALVSTAYTKRVSDLLPSPHNFDHVICMMELAGRTFWLDGTVMYQKGRLSNLGYHNLGYALVVNHPQKLLVKMPEIQSVKPDVAVEEDYLVIEYESPVEFNVKTTYRGRLADGQRRYLATNRKTDISRQYLNYYAKSYPTILPRKTVVVEDDAVKNEIIIKESYWIEDFWERREDKLVTTLRGGTLFGYVALPEVVNRRMPLAVFAPMKIRNKVSVRYPDFYSMNFTETHKKVEDKAIRYEFKTDYLNNRIIIEHLYETKADHVMPKDMMQHIKNLKTIREYLFYDYEIEYEKSSDSDAVSYLLKELKKITGR